ncbi:hypothetical protein [Mycoplasma putrefaciens]|uniref:Uncharacterized protein n=1 Tax=Mycoplasma putrefaciens Mput9231 TaxID=1292033 RepID=M9W9N5_9MOLU|nr:hypothetical protein [Mycoplasma putrefaciens]AGJ90718.1 Hypothetical protein, putative lipoprotein [Mycoplasma putrefaciens Mput9231]
MKKLLSIFSTLTITSTPVVCAFQPLDRSNTSISSARQNLDSNSESENSTSNILNNLRPIEIDLAKELERDYLERVKVLQSKLDSIKKELDNQQSLIEKLKQDLQVKQDQLDDLLSESDSSSGELNTQKQQLIKQLKELIKQQNQYTNIYNQFNNQISELALYNTTLTNDVRKQELDINQHTSTKKQLEIEKVNFIKSKDERIQLYQKNISELLKQIQELQKPGSQLKTLESKVGQLKNKINHLNDTYSDKEKELTNLEDQFSLNRNKIETLQSENKELNTELEKIGLNKLLVDQQELQTALDQLNNLKRSKDLMKNSFRQDETIFDLMCYDSRYYNYFQFSIDGRKPKQINYDSSNYNNFSLGSSVTFASYNLQRDLGVSSFEEFKQKYNKITLEADYCFNGGEIYDHHSRTNNFIRTFPGAELTSDGKPIFKRENRRFEFSISSNTKDNERQKLDEIRQWSGFYVHGFVYWRIQLSKNFINFIVEQRTSVYYKNSWYLQPMSILYLKPKKLKFEADRSYIYSKIQSIKSPVNDIISMYKN